MIGFYYCPHCGKTHDNWMHGQKLMVCAVCKARESVRYNYPVRGEVFERDLTGLHLSPENQEMIRSNVPDEFNKFDLDGLKKIGSVEFKAFIKQRPDDYIKFAFYNFKDPDIVWKEFYERDKLECKGIDVLSYLSDPL